MVETDRVHQCPKGFYLGGSNNLVECRQAIFEHGLDMARMAQPELVDVLLPGQAEF